MSSASPRVDIMKLAAMKQTGEGSLPPINRRENEQEKELLTLMSKNLLFEKKKQSVDAVGKENSKPNNMFRSLDPTIRQ